MTLMHYTLSVADNPQVKLLSFGNSAKSFKSAEVVDYASLLFHDG
jgi:hypothetical protein